MAIDFPISDQRGRELLLIVERAKYERWISQQTAALIEREFSRVIDTILSPSFRDLTLNQRQRTLELFRELDRIIASGYRNIETLHLTEMRGYAQLEADLVRVVAASLVDGVTIRLGVGLPRVFLESIARMPIQGLSIGQWFEAQANSMSLATRRVVQQGLVEGVGTAAISRRVMASDRVLGAVVSRRARQEATTISRTIVNAVQNSAQRQSAASLPRDVSDSYRWLSVMDKRTTIICAALDGRVWKYDDPDGQIPPAHVNCRSTILPVIKGADISIGEQKTGPMSLRSYADWLAAQPVTVQNEILGATRARYLRDGKMTLSDAIDADNRVLTLAELRSRLGLDT